MIRTHASYLQKPLFQPEELIESARRVIPFAEVQFDTFVGTGMSGTLVVPLLARQFDKSFMLVRKDGDGSHSCSRCEGALGARWVFVDDLIDTGATLRRVQNAILHLANCHVAYTEQVGTFLYAGFYGGEWRGA